MVLTFMVVRRATTAGRSRRRTCRRSRSWSRQSNATSFASSSTGS